MTELAHSFPIHTTWLLAQGGTTLEEKLGSQPGGSPSSGTPGTPASGTAPASGGGGPSMMLILAIPLIFLVLMSFMMNKKEKKKRQSLMDAVKRNDRVLTIGGIIGTVVEIRDDEIVLRVDDNTKTKISFSKASVQQVIRSSEGSGGAGGSSGTVETKSKSEKLLSDA